MLDQVKAVGTFTFAKDDVSGLEMRAHRAICEQSDVMLAYADKKRMCSDIGLKFRTVGRYHKVVALILPARISHINFLL